MASLLKAMRLIRTGEKEMVLGEEEGDNYIIRTQGIVDDPLKYDGFAAITRKEGDLKLFEGLFKQSRREGYGIEYASDGSMFYEGTFKDNCYHGWGVTASYEGEFKEGKKEGWGVLNEPEKDICYEGYFKDDKFEGIGAMNVNLEEMDAFIGRKGFYEDNKLHFVGEWREGKMEGRGKLVTADEVYTGQLVNSLFEGEGKLVNKQGSQEGTFKQGESRLR